MVKNKKLHTIMVTSSKVGLAAWLLVHGCISRLMNVELAAWLLVHARTCQSTVSIKV